MESKQIIIIADDLGWHPRINEKIISLLEAGRLSGASLAPNAPYFEHAVDLIKTKPSLANYIGVHLNVYRGRPLTENSDLKKILKKGGFCRSSWRIYHSTLCDSSLRGAIFEEYKAQIERMISNHLNPSFINSEKHLHWLPALWGGAVRLAVTFKIPYIRTCFCPGASAKGLILSHIGKNNQREIDPVENVRHPRALYGVGFSGESLIRHFYEWTDSLEPGISEIVCHPGGSVREMMEYSQSADFKSSLDNHREIEASFLLNWDAHCKFNASNKPSLNGLRVFERVEN